jgi:hypothetical protein
MADLNFIARASDPDAVIWSLKIDQAGKATLLYNDDEVAELMPGQSTNIFRLQANPAERAEDLVDAITSDLAVLMHESARASLESDLSRWIAARY